MNTLFADNDGAPRAPAALPAAKPLLQTLTTLVRREFWEYRGLWLGPLCMAALVALAALVGHVNFDITHAHDDKLRLLLTPQGRAGITTVVQWVVTAPLFVMTLFVLSYYLLDTLYAERQDRSILFWKSLPVSDGLTVASKLVTALLVVPLGVFVLAIATQLVFSLIIALRVATGSAPDLLSWSFVSWVQLEIVMLLELLVGALWYAPIAALFLLMSVGLRRPVLWAVAAPILLPTLEWIAFRTHFLWSFFRYRTVGIWHVLVQGVNINPQTMAERPLSSALLSQLNFAGAFASIDLWLGIVAAAAMVYATIRIRRYRDDT